MGVGLVAPDIVSVVGSDQWDAGLAAHLAVAGAAAEPMDPALLEEVLEAHRSEAREACGTRGRYRYTITAYSNRRGSVRSAGGVVYRGGKKARELLPCLLEQVRGWKLPRSKQRWNKVTFTL